MSIDIQNPKPCFKKSGFSDNAKKKQTNKQKKKKKKQKKTKKNFLFLHLPVTLTSYLF